MFQNTEPKAAQHDSPRVRIGPRITNLRTKAGLTQADLARRAGVSLKTLYTIERAAKGSNFTFLSLESIAEALGTSVADLVLPAQPGGGA